MPSDIAEDAQAQIASLRAQVETLMRDRVQPAVDQARHEVKRQADALSGQVKLQPLAAVGIALAIGILLGRASR